MLNMYKCGKKAIVYGSYGFDMVTKYSLVFWTVTSHEGRLGLID
jgi:hypothetical protein